MKQPVAAQNPTPIAACAGSDYHRQHRSGPPGSNLRREPQADEQALKRPAKKERRLLACNLLTYQLEELDNLSLQERAGRTGKRQRS